MAHNNETIYRYIANYKIASYFQPPAGNTEKYISILPDRCFAPTISSYQAFKNYTIKGIGQGLYAAEEILKHILVNKLNQKIAWKSDVWNKTVVIHLKCDLKAIESGRYFDEFLPVSLNDISEDFAITEGAARIKDIENYAMKMRDNADMGFPVYVSGKVLNYVGGNVNPKGIYMVDGARRIAANALNHQRAVAIQLLIHEDELAQLLEEKNVQEIRDQIASIKWFNNYQSIPLVGLKGLRSLGRFDLMNMSMLQDQEIMDFGCNIGQTCVKSMQAGARNVWGIEGMPDTWKLADSIGKITGFKNLHYLNVDFNDENFNRIIDGFCPGKVDFSFFFSVYRTKELTQRDRLFHYIINKTKKGIFFEGHADPNIDSLEYYDWLFDSFGLQYKFLGYSEGNLRPLFFIDKNPAAQSEETQKTRIVLGVNLFPCKDEAYLNRQQACIQTVDAFRDKGLIPLNVCYEDEVIQPDGWAVDNTLQRSADSELNIKGKRKPFINDIFNHVANWTEKSGIKYFWFINSDILLTDPLIELTMQSLDEGYETIIVSRNELQLDVNNKLQVGYLEYRGYDAFIVSLEWWNNNKERFRDYIIGERAWDDAYASIMFTHSNSRVVYRTGYLFHPKHDTDWLESAYSEYNMDLYNGQDKKYKDNLRAFLDHVGTKDPVAWSKVELDQLINQYFKSDQPMIKKDFVNICMVTYNRLDYTKQAIESIVAKTNYQYVLTVIDNNSSDGTQDYLKDLHKRGIIKNLVLLDQNIGIAKASNLAWQTEPDAKYYLKYDNDIIIQKYDWLENMVKVVDEFPEIGVLGYNFEPASYPVVSIKGYKVRIKQHGNIGGACALIPKRTEKLLGYWCEDYGLYSEEDSDYGFRVLQADKLNVYMEDENAGIHLPAGKAASIDPKTLAASDGIEEIQDRQYRHQKDHQRRNNIAILNQNIKNYINGTRPLYISSVYTPDIFKDKFISGSIPCQTELSSFSPIIGQRNMKIPSEVGIDISTVVTKKGTLSLRVRGIDGFIKTLHSLYDPEAEARSIVGAFQFDRKGILVVLGLGLGYHLVELARKFPEAEILVVEALPEIYEIAKEHGPELDKRIKFITGLSIDAVLSKITQLQMKNGIDSLSVFSLSPAEYAFPNYYRPIFASLKNAMSLTQ